MKDWQADVLIGEPDGLRQRLPERLDHHSFILHTHSVKSSPLSMTYCSIAPFSMSQRSAFRQVLSRIPRAQVQHVEL
jgi:hypothetical protein